MDERETDLRLFRRKIAEVVLPDHANYPEDCSCDICTEWRSKRDIFLAAHDPVKNHGRSCMCSACKYGRKLYSSYRAADNRRDLYSEMSFQSAYLADGDRIMLFVVEQITGGKRTDGWWEGRAPYYSVGWWLLQAKNHIAATEKNVTPTPRRGRGRKGEKGKTIVNTALLFLKEQKRRATSKELAIFMRSLKIEICLNGAEDKRITAYLSASPLFNFRRDDGGYGLVEWN